MSPEDMIRAMQGNQQPKVQVPVALLDEFIERCIKEKGYTEHTLSQTIDFKLQEGVHSPYEAEILPMVVQRMNGSI